MEPHADASSASAPSSMNQPHAVCFPFPTQSHITAMLNLAKLLHSRGISVTFINTEFNHGRLLKACTPGFLDHLPNGFQFATIPDGLPLSQANATQDLIDLCRSIRHLMGAPLCALVDDLNKKASETDKSVSGSPPVSCILTDVFMTHSANPVREKFGIPMVTYVPIAACSVMSFTHFPTLKDKGVEQSNEAPVDWIPGLKNMTVRDMPSLSNIDPDGVLFDLVFDALKRIGESDAAIIHTFEKLEADALSALSSPVSIPVYAIGPLKLLIDRFITNEDPLKHIGSNLWKEDTECLPWLDLQEPESVLYINFGSITRLTPEQLIEFAMGIANSRKPFLWIIRPDLVYGETAVLPPEFNEETKGRAYISEWCPQEKVLNHPSVKGFLTHCGWNSILESLAAGVPMLCWPFAGDQRTNSKYVCKDWEAGLEIRGDVNRDEVERLVEELMEGEKGKHVKRKAMNWKRLAFEAISENGSSSSNFDKLVSLITSK